MGRRVTIKDISKKLGVSTTTVTKALNGKPKVSEQVRKMVLACANEMGYVPNQTAKALVRNVLDIGIVFPEQPAEFYGYIKKGLEKGIDDLFDFKVRGVFHPVKDLNSVQAMKESLEKLIDAGVDGIIFSPGFYLFEYSEIIDKINKSGIPLLFLVNGVSSMPGTGNVRMNGKTAGRVASQFLSFCMGKERNVVIFACNKEILIQKECINGFIEESEKNGLVVKGIYETQDDKNIAYYLTEKLLRERPEVKGIYVSSYNSVAVCNCLEKYNKADEIFVIGQDLYPELVEKLENGSLKATLFQDPVGQGRKAVEIMYNHLVDCNKKMGDYFISPQLVMTSNLENYKSYYA